MRGKGGWGPPIRGWGNACGNLISYPHNPNSPRTNTKDRPPLPSPKPGGWKGNFSARGGKIGLHHPVGSARGSCRPRVVLPHWGNILLWGPMSLGYWAGIKWPHQMIGDPPPARCPPPSPPHGLEGRRGIAPHIGSHPWCPPSPRSYRRGRGGIALRGFGRPYGRTPQWGKTKTGPQLCKVLAAPRGPGGGRLF